MDLLLLPVLVMELLNSGRMTTRINKSPLQEHINPKLEPLLIHAMEICFFLLAMIRLSKFGAVLIEDFKLNTKNIKIGLETVNLGLLPKNFFPATIVLFIFGMLKVKKSFNNINNMQE